jgi:hypothetical protein
MRHGYSAITLIWAFVNSAYFKLHVWFYLANLTVTLALMSVTGPPLLVVILAGQRTGGTVDGRPKISTSGLTPFRGGDPYRVACMSLRQRGREPCRWSSASVARSRSISSTRVSAAASRSRGPNRDAGAVML